MIEKFKNFELDKKEQKEINGSTIVPNEDACARATGLYSGGSWWAGVGMWIHC
ncbi:hypothetical protein ACQY1Q_00380 [Tenacibaculum sp. TC6]|uniref:hypothetical protein n=1 Tax=Tenacibaculum sp. TC6 TaxID=3423223 RepID=UPI003D35B161